MGSKHKSARTPVLLFLAGFPCKLILGNLIKAQCWQEAWCGKLATSQHPNAQSFKVIICLPRCSHLEIDSFGLLMVFRSRHELASNLPVRAFSTLFTKMCRPFTCVQAWQRQAKLGVKMAPDPLRPATGLLFREGFGHLLRAASICGIRLPSFLSITSGPKT